VILVAFDLIEHDGDDLRERPLISRKRLLAQLIGKKVKTWRAIQYGDHLVGDGPAIFDHVGQLGWKASCRSMWIVSIVAGHRRCG
jgi:bifunctional non-homologous end joining protein LigD